MPNDEARRINKRNLSFIIPSFVIPPPMPRYSSLVFQQADDLVFGRAKFPLTTRYGLVIGGGVVYPELNFTLPDVAVEQRNLPLILTQYREMVTGALERAVELHVPGLVIEFETLPPMTEHPDWAMRIVEVLLEAIEQAHSQHGLKAALRVTPNDNREFERPTRLRSGRYWERMLELFHRAAAAGADMLAIESMGGKEIHDEALQFGNLRQSIFAQCVLGVRDMQFVWSHIVPIAKEHGVCPSGDTACALGNTAMVLAEQGMIPRVFAAVVRAVSAVRSLVAYECGAIGPGKDCGYENIILKAITGLPMACEGKTASCAHLSPVGNVAAAACDLWSNESVQNVRLLGGMAPTCMLESLVYDCRLMNEALADGDAAARRLRDWLVRGDARLDPQAYILTPDSAVRLARRLVAEPNHYLAGRAVADEAITILREAFEAGELALAEREQPWLQMMRDEVDALPDDEQTLIDELAPTLDPAKFIAAEYNLAG
jgi:methanol--5-hydroxybenzimidazolylcobamide Co-methyltransferase